MSMIQVQEARDQILSKIKVKGVEKVSLDQALGRVLAEDIVAGLNNPPLSCGLSSPQMARRDVATRPGGPISNLHLEHSMRTASGSRRINAPSRPKKYS